MIGVTEAFGHMPYELVLSHTFGEEYDSIVKEEDCPVNHGNSLAFCFEDPEGNRIEIYWAAHLCIHQPFANPINLDLSEAKLLQQVQQVAEQFASEEPPWTPPCQRLYHLLLYAKIVALWHYSCQPCFCKPDYMRNDFYIADTFNVF